MQNKVYILKRLLERVFIFVIVGLRWFYLTKPEVIRVQTKISSSRYLLDKTADGRVLIHHLPHSKSIEHSHKYGK